jgi:hypothetical protein
MPTSYILPITRLIIFQMRRRDMDVAVDSSGFRLKTGSKWFDIMITCESEKRDYIKLHIVIDVDTGIILQYTITDWKGADPTELKRLVKDLPHLGNVVGDKAYSSRANCQAAADKKANHFFVSRETLRVRRKNVRRGTYPSTPILIIQTAGWRCIT